MTTKQTTLFSFFLKSLIVIVVFVALMAVGLNVWSRSTFKKAQTAFEVAATAKANTSETCSRAQLLATAKAASELDYDPDEKKQIGTLATRALDQWTTEDERLVAVVADRNRAALESIALALVSTPADDGFENDPDHQVFRSPIEMQLLLSQASRLFAAEARLALRTGNGEFAVERLTTLRLLVEGLESQGQTLDLLMGFYLERILDSCLLEAVVSNSPILVEDPQRFALLVPQVDLRESLRSALSADVSLWVGEWDDAEWDRTLPGVVANPITKPIIKRLLKAAFLDMGTHLLDLIETPFGSDPTAFTSPPEPPRWRVIRRLTGLALPNMLNMIGRCQATLALRQFFEAALAMQTVSWPDQAFPEARPDLQALNIPDPFSGQLLEYQLMGDGRLHLGVAGSLELYEALHVPDPERWMDPVILEPPTTEQTAARYRYHSTRPPVAGRKSALL